MTGVSLPRQITCFLPRGKAGEIVGRLNAEKRIPSASVTSGRGRALVDTPSFGEWVEVDILTVIVDRERADEIFEFVFDAGDVDRMHGGLMYQNRLTQATRYALPDIPSEEKS
jgi:hypothetical protein